MEKYSSYSTSLPMWGAWAIVILTGVKWNPKLLLICISQMAEDVEHLFLYHLNLLCWEFCLDLYLICWKDYLDFLFCLTGLILFDFCCCCCCCVCPFLTPSFLISLYFRILVLYQIQLVKIFSHSVGCCFVIRVKENGSQEEGLLPNSTLSCEFICGLIY